MDTLSERLTAAIGSREHSEVAQAAGIDRKTLYRLLNGCLKTDGTVSTIRALARVLGVRFGWLGGNEGSPGRADLDAQVEPLDERLCA